MEMWFTEKHTADVKFSIRVDRQIYTGPSDFQRIDVFESKEFGRFLTLDGYMMLTERDEFIYHEMITHVPMAVHPAVRNVLVIGAGDGGVVRELTRYPALENIDMVEIDPLVVEVSKKYLPQTACRLNDERVHIYYEDGLRFVRSKEDLYDLIIVDSTFPEVLVALFVAICAVVMMALFFEGWCGTRMNWPLRAVCFIAAVMMILPYSLCDIIGGTISVAMVIYLLVKYRKTKQRS